MADVQSLFFLARMATYVIARRNTDTSMTFRTAWWLTWGDFFVFTGGRDIFSLPDEASDISEISHWRLIRHGCAV